MFSTKAALVLLLHAHSCLLAGGQSIIGGGECLDYADIAIVLDVSGSIEDDGRFAGRFDRYVKPFIKAYVGSLNVAPGKDQVGLITFGDVGTLEFGLMSDINEVMRRIDQFDFLSRGKRTNTSGGIYVMRTRLLSPMDPNYRPNAAHIALVVTDGMSNYDHDLTIPYSRAAQNEGIIMLAVGVTKELNLDELTGIASQLTPFNISSLQNGIKNGVFTLSGTVCYVPEIADLISVAKQLVTHLKNTICAAVESTRNRIQSSRV